MLLVGTKILRGVPALVVTGYWSLRVPTGTLPRGSSPFLGSTYRLDPDATQTRQLLILEIRQPLWQGT